MTGSGGLRNLLESLKTKNMINLEDITVLNDIRDRLAQITPEQVHSAARRLDRDDKSEAIGVIESETTRALYTLAVVLTAEEALEEAKAKGAVDEMIEKDHLERAAVLDMLHDVVKNLFFTQAKTDLGFHQKESVSLSGGWTLVKTRQSPPEGLIRLLGGAFPA